MLYEENLDLQQWKRDAHITDAWLTEKEDMLKEDWRKVEDVDDADNKIRFVFFLFFLSVRNFSLCEHRFSS